MWLIVSLIIIGVLLLVAELILLPGLTVAGIGGLVSFGVAIYLGFSNYGVTGGTIVIIAILAISVASIIISLRARTWQRLSLKENIDSTSQFEPEQEVEIGAQGVTITRLAPMGNVTINNKTYEAKSLGDLYIDPKTKIEVVGYENFNIIVKTIE